MSTIKHVRKLPYVCDVTDEIPISIGFYIPNIEDIIQLINTLTVFVENTLQKDIDNYNNGVREDIRRQNELYLEETKKTKRASEGYVYLIIGENGRYKIGASKNPKSRITSLKISSCEDHILIHTIKSNDMYVLEKQLHNKYEAFKTHSEWFSLTDKEVAEIKGIL